MTMTRSLAVLLTALALALPAVAPAQSLAPVELATARESALVEELNLTGSLTAPRRAMLSPSVAGRIERIDVEAGDFVDAGMTLVVLDGELARFELAQARAAEREAETQLADAVRRLDEARRLAQKQSFAETEVRSRESEVARQRAVADRLRAVSAFDQVLVERHSLEAPFGGVVASRLAELGEWVGPDDPVLELVAVERLRLDLQVPQGYFGRIDDTTEMNVTLDAVPDQRFTARISRVVPVSDPAARTFLVRAELDNRDGAIAPGMSGRATLRIGVGRTGVVVPRDALIRYPDGRTVVWVTRGDGEQRSVEEQRVQTGLTTAREVEIREGLAAGTEVVVRGNEALRQGQEVRVRAPQ